MLQRFSRPPFRPLCTLCYQQQRTYTRSLFSKRLTKLQLPVRNTTLRSFHSTRPSPIPIIPFPAIFLGALKTGKLVSFVSLSSKTSLTLLPHTFRRGSKGDTIAKILVSIPGIGFLLLLAVGLDQVRTLFGKQHVYRQPNFFFFQAPNTSRLRLIYLSEEEENQIVEAEINGLLEAQSGLIAEKDNEVVMWLQTIVDNLAAVAVDDIRDPVRRYSGENNVPSQHLIQVVPKMPDSGEVDVMLSTKVEDEGFKPVVPTRNFQVNVICDSTTINAMCAGSSIVVYDMLLYCMDYDTNRMAVILSHEIAHSLQRHFVEQHGFASLMFMLGDITRGVFWMITESLGPYVNQKINECISTFIDLETQTTYNRKLEKEADLVGLKILAKAGYDPTIAIDVWERMSKLENALENEMEKIEKTTAEPPVDRALLAAKKSIPSSSNNSQEENYGDIEFGVREFLDSLVNTWFGSSHPPSTERVEYMRQHMDEAVLIYKEAIKLNGEPTQFLFNPNAIGGEEQVESSRLSIFTQIRDLLSYVYPWSSKDTTTVTKSLSPANKTSI